ncbi:hypothetical protein [Legionella micdadei]|uniref:Dot/Icm secretion system substrate n=1 Tax=Legionella micdadei TaxID=451 RepID=A0A098GIX0_LEGMI|nr:hypothetical protein [Legionella micdadei]ARG96700.1 hypothetical protein B6N58_02880 [Legionella micdadei]ARG99447.1 hypothetical protein B6V88_02870 [Legionella micdadei]KTD26365.1 Dot/Icm secretion system substrate [Legionella micdadei]NSL19059.1 hypothetical protein [Legionella micdadei]CEG61920.1 conserved protein of unknown function [Legionella micdadei]
METNEHKQVGDQIRIEPLKNRYLKGSTTLSEDPENNLIVTMMSTVNGIPVPLKLELSAGDIVAMAGDYYTKAGWGYKLTLPARSSDVIAENEALFKIAVSKEESRAFREAYEDLASPTVKKADIDKIYAIENTTYIPFFKSLNGLFQQLVYSFTVKGYSDKLNQNSAHFAPWSARAYVVGHESALRMATLAFYFKQLAENHPENIPTDALSELQSIIEQIKRDPKQYDFKLQQIANDETLYTELWQRYHALAISRDLFAMHFYSDHFAGGHMSRIGLLREEMPKRFGVLGGILINNMHNEDNTDSVRVVNPYEIEGSSEYITFREDSQAYGDGTYFKRSNDETSNLLINGMDNSLGDIARLMKTGEQLEASDYGGLAFLPEVDYTKAQPQPLLIYGLDGKIYFRADVSQINMLSPEDYKKTLENPEKHGYKELNLLEAIKLVLKLRVFGFFLAPKPAKPQVKLGISLQKKTETDEGTELNLSPTIAAEPVFTGGHRKALRASYDDLMKFTLYPPPQEKEQATTTSEHLLTVSH